MKFFGGVDPGYSSGAVCLLSEDTKKVIFHDINDKQPSGVMWHTSLVHFFREYKHALQYIAVERVHTSPMMGVVSAGKFYGAWMVLELLADLTDQMWISVLPTKWQESLGVTFERDKLEYDQSPEERAKIRRKNKTDLKKSVYYWAKATYPHAELRSFKLDSNRADALGIAHYAMTTYRKQFSVLPAYV